jgi:hypothetical protein
MWMTFCFLVGKQSLDLGGNLGSKEDPLRTMSLDYEEELLLQGLQKLTFKWRDFLNLTLSFGIYSLVDSGYVQDALLGNLSSHHNSC